MSGDGEVRDHDEEYPSPRAKTLVCPYCGTRVGVSWWPTNPLPFIKTMAPPLEWATCLGCAGLFISLDQTLIYPSGLLGPVPSADMPELVRTEYNEARKVGAASPRAAAALLRLAIQKLVDELQPGKENLDLKIGLLVQDGRIRQRLADMLDVVRVTGNYAVHPGLIDLNDEPERVITLFKLVNAIMEQTITLDQIGDEAHASLPEGALQGIAQRPDKVKRHREPKAEKPS